MVAKSAEINEKRKVLKQKKRPETVKKKLQTQNLKK